MRPLTGPLPLPPPPPVPGGVRYRYRRKARYRYLEGAGWSGCCCEDVGEIELDSSSGDGAAKAKTKRKKATKRRHINIYLSAAAAAAVVESNDNNNNKSLAGDSSEQQLCCHLCGRNGKVGQKSNSNDADQLARGTTNWTAKKKTAAANHREGQQSKVGSGRAMIDATREAADLRLCVASGWSHGQVLARCVSGHLSTCGCEFANWLGGRCFRLAKSAAPPLPLPPTPTPATINQVRGGPGNAARWLSSAQQEERQEEKEQRPTRNWRPNFRIIRSQRDELLIAGAATTVRRWTGKRPLLNDLPLLLLLYLCVCIGFATSWPSPSDTKLTATSKWQTFKAAGATATTATATTSPPAANNDNNNNNYRWPFVGLVGFMFIGAAGNILVCMAIWRERRLQTATNYFLLSLAVADLLVCTLVMPFGIIYEFYGHWPFDDWRVCNLWVTCDVLTCSSSILHMCFISVGRYLGIRNPLHARQANLFVSRRAVLWRIAIAWISAALIASPITMMSLLDLHNIVPARGECAISNKYFLMFGSLLAFFIPMFAMVPSYVMTVRLLSRRAKYVRNNSLLATAGRAAAAAVAAAAVASGLPASTAAAATAATQQSQVQLADDKEQSSAQVQVTSAANSNEPQSKRASVEKAQKEAEEQKPPEAISAAQPHAQPLAADCSPSAQVEQPGKQDALARALAESNFIDDADVDKEQRPTQCRCKPLRRRHCHCSQCRADRKQHSDSSSVTCYSLGQKLSTATTATTGTARTTAIAVLTTTTQPPPTDEPTDGCKQAMQQQQQWRSICRHRKQCSHPAMLNTPTCSTGAAGAAPSHHHHHHHHRRHHHHHLQRNLAKTPHRRPTCTCRCPLAEPEPLPEAQATPELCPQESSANSAQQVRQQQQQVSSPESDFPEAPQSAVQAALLGAAAPALPAIAVRASPIPQVQAKVTPTASVVAKQCSRQSSQNSNQQQRHPNLISIDHFSSDPPQMIRYLGSSMQVRSEQKATKVLGLVFFTFVICWTPFFTINFTQAFVEREQLARWISNEMMTTFLWLGYISSTINPVIYTVFNRNFRKAFRQLILCRPANHRYNRSHANRNADHNKSFRLSQRAGNVAHQHNNNNNNTPAGHLTTGNGGLNSSLYSAHYKLQAVATAAMSNSARATSGKGGKGGAQLAERKSSGKETAMLMLDENHQQVTGEQIARKEARKASQQSNSNNNNNIANSSTSSKGIRSAFKESSNRLLSSLTSSLQLQQTPNSTMPINEQKPTRLKLSFVDHQHQQR